ncbi:MAG: hypothetical protein HKM98_01260 [Gammaproteobacteria bacterium]|nr:hypothetical protein [Gammaproteobacteria bacterium]
MTDKISSRRFFLRLSAVSLLAPVLGRLSMAQEALSENDATASALGYKADASTVDDPGYKDGSTCLNCLQFKAGADNSGSCGLFPGKDVSAAGWCRAWVKKS